MTYSNSISKLKLKKEKLWLCVCVLCVLVITGCSKNNNEQANNLEQNQNQQQLAGADQFNRWNDNFEEADLSDLEISQQILVMGTVNDDGSISANQIMIGDKETDFINMPVPEMTDGPINGGNGNEGETNADNGATRPPADFEGQGPGGFENIPEKEKAQMMEKMRERRGEMGADRLPSGGAREGQGITRAIGTIMDMDESTITMQLEEGGSKLIFYSMETEVLKPKMEDTNVKEAVIE